MRGQCAGAAHRDDTGRDRARQCRVARDRRRLWNNPLDASSAPGMPGSRSPYRGKMAMRMVRLLMALLGLALAASAWADDPAPTPPAAAEDKSAFIRSLHWVRGPAQVQIGENATFDVPKGTVFLNPDDTKKLMEAMQNPSSGKEYLFGPESLSWFGIFEYVDSGYVKDDEQIDAEALLKSFRENAEESNKYRKDKGWEPIEITGWKYPPRYDSASRRLEWAIDVRSKSGSSINFNTRLLGRHGVTSALLVSSPENLDANVAAFKDLVGGYAFKSSERYDDFKAGDRVAEYGLAALILGGAAAVAAKKGLFAVVGGFLVAFWKLIAGAAVAIAAAIRARLKRRPG
jgi:uncharacterized membrane-anchored protein